MRRLKRKLLLLLLTSISVNGLNGCATEQKLETLPVYSVYAVTNMPESEQTEPELVDSSAVIDILEALQ